MPFYQRLGELPRKRHIVFRDNGTLLTEEVMGFEGFTGLESILYHLHSPCRVVALGPFEPIVREEWVPETHAHRHFKTWGTPSGGDAISGRRLLMWNNDVEISLCRPPEPMESFFRNGEGDEVIFVHEGSGTVETTFGDLPPVFCHGGELNQALLNIIVNAAHAIEDVVGQPRPLPRGEVGVLQR